MTWGRGTVLSLLCCLLRPLAFVPSTANDGSVGVVRFLPLTSSFLSAKLRRKPFLHAN